MIYSKACEYGIRAMTHLALHPDERSVVRDISADEDVPHYFLGKILQTLAKHGLVSSTKGPGGGFGLAKPAAEITLYDIRAAIDGNDDLYACAVGYESCSTESPCALHDDFEPLRDQIIDYLQSTTLAAMANAVESKRTSAA
ncbi:MAG: Rrf2 family transcriptional regulator [Candidatus Bipolaricaulia bacterium]